MQEFLKEIIVGIVDPFVLPLFYIGGFTTILITVFKRAEVGVYVLGRSFRSPTSGMRSTAFPWARISSTS